VFDGVNDVLNSEVRAEGCGGSIGTAEVGMNEVPPLSDGPASKDGAVRGLVVANAPGVKADEEWARPPLGGSGARHGWLRRAVGRTGNLDARDLGRPAFGGLSREEGGDSRQGEEY
jgi:hypothetical protein